MASAACVGRGEDFFAPNNSYAQDRAKQVCAGCPVRSQCHAYAESSPNWLLGVWGGADLSDRRRIRRRRYPR